MSLSNSKCDREDNQLTKMLFCQAFCCGVLVLYCAPDVSMAWSVGESVTDEAVSYLLSQQSAQGYWSQGDRRVVDTVEAVKALEPLSDRPAVAAAIARSQRFTTGLDETNNDVLARKLRVLAKTAVDVDSLREVLLAGQNADGGWGLGAKEQSNVLDTILVADALLHDGDAGNNYALSAARDFIVWPQDADMDFWILADERAPSDVARAAMALVVLKDIERAGLADSAAAHAALKARDFLEAEVDPNDPNLSCAQIALTWRALLYLRQPYDVNEYLERLLSSQASDGSWEQDVFTTAVVLQALNAAQPAELADMADLAVYDRYIAFSPAGPSTGQQVNISAMVTNEGQATAGGFYVEFYNGDPNSGGQLIDSAQYIEAIAPGSAAQAQVTYSDTDTNDLYDEQMIVVVVDPDNDVNETTYSNNFAWKILTFSGKTPDLEIDNPAGITFYDIEGNILTDPCAYQPIVIVAEVTNAGAKTEADFNVKMEDTTDPNVSDAITIVGGLVHDQVVKATFMVALSQGEHTIEVTVDDNNSVTESNENNNTATKDVNAGPYGGPANVPDLKIETSDIVLSDTNVMPGDTITINATIHNISQTIDSNGFYVRISDGSPYAGGSVIRDDIYVSTIAAGGSVAIPTVTYEVVYNAGGNEIFVLADCNGDVYEYDKVNNLASKKLNVPNLPDLTTSSYLIRFSHDDLAINRGVQVLVTVRNVGNAEATDVSVKFAVKDGAAYHVFGEDTVETIAACGAAEAGTTWYPDANVSYTIAVLIDDDGKIPEAGEQNNIAELAGVIFSDGAAEPNISLYLGESSEPNDEYGAYDWVRVEVVLDPCYADANDYMVFVWGRKPDGDFFWPDLATAGSTSIWYFDTGAMAASADGNDYYYINADVIDLRTANIIQQTYKAFTIAEEVDLIIPWINIGQRFVRLGNDPCISPAVQIKSRSNVTVDVDLAADLYEPNDPNDPNTRVPVCTWTRDKITLEPGDVCSVQLEDCNGFNTAGTYDLRVTVSNLAGPETAEANDTFPVIPALGLDVSKTLDPEFVNPTEYARAEVSIVVESTGMAYEADSLDVILIIDVSNSMKEYGKLTAAKAAAVAFAEKLLGSGRDCRVGVLAFTDGLSNVSEPLPLTKYFGDVSTAIGSAGGDCLGTNIRKAIETAIGLFDDGQPQRKRLAILLSDGDGGLPTYIYPAARTAFIDHRITIFTVGIGLYHKVEVMTEIARLTYGLYYPCDAQTVDDAYDQIYTDVTTSGIRDIEVTDLISYDANLTVPDLCSVRPTPVSVEQEPNSGDYVITWELPSLEFGEQFEFEYEVELFNLVPNEERVVNRSLEVTAYDTESQEQMTVEIGEQSVKVAGATGLSITTDQDTYTPGQLAELTTFFDAPDALRHAIIGSAEHFAGAEVTGVDVNSQPGSVVLWRNDDTRQYGESGTLNLIVDAGSGAYWGNIDFSGWYPGQYEIFDKINNYLRSNVVTDVHFYQRTTQGDAWWEDSNDSWYAEVDDTVVDNALITDEGWIAYVPLTGRMDDELDSNDYTIEGWISTDANGILFYRGDGTDANYLSIYAYDYGAGEKLHVDCNIGGYEPNFNPVDLALDSDDWHYVVLTVADGNAALYIDGNEPNSTWTYEMDVMSELYSMPVLIGGDAYPTLLMDYRTFRCRVDEVRIYDRALEPNEIWENYTQAQDFHVPSDVGAGLVGYWDFDPGPQDQSELELGGMFTKAYLDNPGYYDLRRITGRSSEPNFPQESYVIAASKSIDIIDAEDKSLWMRFPTHRTVLWCEEGVPPSCIYAHDGALYVGQNNSAVGLSIIDFKKDEIRNILPEVPDGLTAHWKLDESSGTTASDSSGNSHNGDLLGGFSFDGSSVTGIMSGALDFNGVSDYVNCPGISFDANGQYTYSVWFRADSSHHGGIVGDHNDLYFGDGWSLNLYETTVKFWSGAYGDSVASASVNSDGNTWYHVAVTYEGDGVTGSGTLYLDAESTANYDDVDFTGSSENFRIGVLYDSWLGGWEKHFDGAIDDVRVYNRVLSADEIRQLYGRANEFSSATIRDRFLSNGSNVQAFVQEVALRDGYIHDVMAARIGDANCIAVGTNKGLSLIKDETDIYDSSTTAQVTNVFLTDTNDLYFVITEPNGDSLYAVYDIASTSDDFGPDAVYGYRDQNAPNLATNEIRDLYVVSGGGGNNIIYMGTPDGVVQIQEDQGQRSAGTRKVYVSWRSDDPNSNDFVNVLAGDSNNVTAVYADANQLWAVTSDGSAGSSQVLSIIDLSSDELADSVSQSWSSQPRLPAGVVTALDWGLVGTKAGAMAFEPDFISPIAIRARCIYSDDPENPGEAVSEWTDWITERPTRLMDVPLADPNSSRPLGRSRYLELEVKLTRGSDPYITPILEAISVGYTPTELAIDVSVEDSGGIEVYGFDRIYITDADMGREINWVHYFETYSSAPTDYNAVARLVDIATLEPLTTAADGFEITGPGGNDANLTGSITTNRRSYETGDVVKIEVVVFNESQSVSADNVEVKVYVQEPNKSPIAPYGPLSYIIDSLGSGANDPKEFSFTVGSNLEPSTDYRALLVVGLGDVNNPSDTAQFEIVGSCQSQNALTGTLHIDHPRITPTNSTLDMAITASTGNEDLTDVTLFVKVFDMSDPNEPNTIATFEFPAGDLTVEDPCTAITFPYTPEDLDPDTYPVKLIGRFRCGDSNDFTEELLATAAFAVIGEIDTPEYIIIDLGAIDDGSSYGHALNSLGHVTGYSTVGGNSHAFLWKCGTMIDLGAAGFDNSIGWGINDSEQIAGCFYDTAPGQDANAFIWQDGAYSDIGSGPNGVHPVEARGINVKGQVTGYYTLADGNRRAFVYPEPPDGNSQWDDLGNSGISAIAGFAESNSVALGIAGDGDLAGYWDGGGGIGGFVRLKGVVKDAGQHGGNDMYLPAINSSGQAAGYSSDAGTDTAILYQDGTRIVLDPCSAESRANGINSAGEIVGTYYDGSDWKAFIWRGGFRHDLKEQLALTSSDPNWWKLTDANAINDQGQIVGYGTIDGKTHAYRLDPLPFEVDDPNLILWLRADAGVVKNTSDANYVSAWIDQSFNGHDVAAPNVSSEPQFVVDTSCCNPRLSFDGVDDVLQSSLTHDGNSTVFMVVTTGSLETGTLFASENGGSDPNAFEIELDGTDLQLTTDSGSYQISPAATESVILEVVIDGNSVRFYKNGRNVKSSTLGDDEAKGYTDVVLGKSRSGGFLAFDVAEVIVFDDALADTRRVQVADYLAAKHWLYGLADVKDPILWYRADGGVTVDTNDKVSKWADQSGGEHHAVQDEPNDRPELADGVLECKPAILFDGEAIDPNIVVGPIDTYLVFDKSGSMQYLDGNARSRLHYAKDAARLYVDRMLGNVHTGMFSQGDDANGIVSMEAENYYLHTERDLTAWDFVMDKPGWSGGGTLRALPTGVSHSNDCNGARLDYRVNFVKTGTHYIWVRCLRENDGSQICHADLDEQDIATAHKINASGVDINEWGWTNIITGSSRATFDVNEAGIHTVNMYKGQGNFRLDKIVLTTNASYTPDGNGPVDTGALEPAADQGHRVGLITFSHELDTAMPLTNDLYQLKQEICGLAYGGHTNYKGAIELMIAEFNDDANGSDAGRRRACVFLSDGKPNKPAPWDDVNSVNDIMAAVDAAVESDITFWTVGVGGTVEPGDPCYDPGAVQILEDMNEHGGGSCAMSPDASELEGVFLEIYYEIVEIFSKQTLSVVFKAAADISRRQVLWALGDPNRGMNLYIDANELYFGAWSRKDSDGNGPETIWGPKYMNTEIEANTPYLVDFVYDHNESTIEGYLNGRWFETASGVGKLFPEQSRVTIGNNPDEPTRFHDDTNDVNNFYTGHIAEVLYYHRALSDAERTDIDEYLAEKFGIEIARDGPPTAIGGADTAATDSDWNGSAYVSLVAETGGLDANGWTFEWYEAGAQIAAGANTVAELDVGRHVIELRVTDDQGRTSVDTVVVTIKDIPGTLASKSLIGHWKLDGDADDCSGNALDANVVNAAEPNCWRDGKVNGAIKLKADSNEYLDLSGDGNDVQYLPGGSSARTIMGWFEAADNGEPTFFDCGTDDPNDAGSRLAICASSQRVAVTIGTHVIGVDNIYPALKGWHHVAAALDGGAWRSDQVKIYVDGVRQFIYTLDSSDGPVAVNTNTWSDNSHGYIGRDCRGNYFDGGIDDVRVYSRALRSPELSVFAAGPMRYHVVDLGLLGPADDPHSGEAHAINNQGDVVGTNSTLLKPDTNYYWRIDEKNQCAVTPGDTWEFTTGPE